MRNPLARIATSALVASAVVIGAPAEPAAQPRPVLAAHVLPGNVDPPREICTGSIPFRVIDSAYLRADAGSSYRAIATVLAGTEVIARCYIDWGTPVGGNPVWRHVTTPSGLDGWMHDSVLRPIPID